MLAKYNAVVVTRSAKRHTEEITGTATTCRRCGDSLLEPETANTNPVHITTTAVATIRTASAVSRESRPDARWIGRTQSRVSNPCSRSRQRGFTPAALEPKMNYP